MKKRIKMISILLSFLIMGGLMTGGQSQGTTAGLNTASHSQERVVPLQDDPDKVQLSMYKEETMAEEEEIEQPNQEEIPDSYFSGREAFETVFESRGNQCVILQSF